MRATPRTSRAATTESDPRWAAVRARDDDAAFFYSVETTGVYCRPSCASRPARPENVAFHASAAAAEQAGFRPCKRCRPELPPRAQRDAALVAALCRAIDESSEPLVLDELARRAGLSPYHTHRLFKAVTGLTPRGYARAGRARRVRERLGDAGTVTEAFHDAGYGSSGRFYAEASAVLGMAPRVFRAGGPAATIRHAVGASSLGKVLVAATETGVCAVLLGDTAAALGADLKRRFPRARLVAGDAAFAATVAAVVAHVEEPRRALALPLDLRGTAFQQRVWAALRRVPAGHTVSYAELARAIGSPAAVRAVAGACANNPVAVAVPCHRVIRGDGGEGGYRWGVERKRALLERERRGRRP